MRFAPELKRMVVMLRKLRIAVKLLIYKLFAKRVRLIGDEPYGKLLFFITFGRCADYDSPKTFNEYICARKSRRDEYDLWQYTDKYEVREYVRETVGEQYLNEVYGVFGDYDEIDFDVLPDRFALRCTHGSGMNMIVTDKAAIDHKKAKKKFQKWLKQNFYYLAREKNYYKIPPRIICDKFLMCRAQEGVPEAKVFCFSGKAKFVSYNMVVNGKTYTNYYDENWDPIDVQIGYPPYPQATAPDNGEELLRIAERLASKFDFVRVDLYNIDGSILFSELTFHSGGGLVPFSPAEYDEKFARFFVELENPV